jgi:Mor family transcriptional regulator
MGPQMTDIITSIIETFKEHVSTITPELAKDIEGVIRKQWGGEQAYIAKRLAIVDSKKQTINNELRAGYSIMQIEHKHGIPRRTIYRLINHKQRA